MRQIISNFPHFFFAFILFISSSGSTELFAQVVSTTPPFDYGNGSEGAFTAPTGTSYLSGIHNYTSFTIPAGSTVNVTGSTPLIIKCTGTVTINGTLAALGGLGGNTLNST